MMLLALLIIYTSWSCNSKKKEMISKAKKDFMVEVLDASTKLTVSSEITFFGYVSDNFKPSENCIFKLKDSKIILNKESIMNCSKENDIYMHIKGDNYISSKISFENKEIVDTTVYLIPMSYLELSIIGLKEASENLDSLLIYTTLVENVKDLEKKDLVPSLYSMGRTLRYNQKVSFDEKRYFMCFPQYRRILSIELYIDGLKRNLTNDFLFTTVGDTVRLSKSNFK